MLLRTISARNLMVAGAVFAALAGANSALAETHPAAPALSSKSGAAYTLYLDFSGFVFSGAWGKTDVSAGAGSPGTTPAYDTDGDASAFAAAEVTQIKQVWARVAEKYSPFNINVTTVDPAVGAGKADTDAHRQEYYDNTGKMMHTIIGGGGSWSSGGGGLSFVDKAQNTYSQYTTGGGSVQNGGAGAGFHTNFDFSALSASDLQFVAESSAHEDGHGLGLNHQSDYTGATLNLEYSTNNGATGNGSYAPIMGNSYTVQRGTWRVGNAHATSGKVTQNDPGVIQSNAGIGNFVNDGIGHTIGTATALPVSSGSVNFNTAKGIIVPVDNTTPDPIGVAKYSNDYFLFHSDGGAINLTCFDGGERLTPGTADPGATLNSTLTILDNTGMPVGNAVLAASTLSETYSGTLPAGDYYALIQSKGGYTSTFDATAKYYDMGSYFLSGLVPEPTCVAIVAMLGAVLVQLRRCVRSRGL